MTSNTIGLFLFIGGSFLWWGTRAAGVAFGRIYRCWIAYAIRVVFGMVLYVLAALIGAHGITRMSAQSFPPDSQTTASRPRSASDSLFQQQMTELFEFKRAQERLEDRRVNDRRDLLRRLDRVEKDLESNKPAVIVEHQKAVDLRLDKVESATEKRDGYFAAVVIAFMGALFASWFMGRKKG